MSYGYSSYGMTPGYSTSSSRYGSYQQHMPSTSTTSSTTPTSKTARTLRCVDDFTTSGSIDIDKMEKLNLKEKTKNRFQKLKEYKRQTNNSKRQFNSIPASNTKRSKERYKLEQKYRDANSKEKKLSGIAYHRLSEHLKKKTIKRLDKMLRNPKNTRLDSFTCSLKALLQILADKACKNSSTTSKTTMETLVSDYEKKIMNEYADYEDLARAYIRFIIQKRDKAPEVLNHINMIDEKFGLVLTTMIESLTTCSE